MKEYKLTEKRIWKVINDWDDPNRTIEDNANCIYYITITKKEIEAENIDRVSKLLNLLLSNLRSLFSFVEKINIDITGYENDPRDLWEIEEGKKIYTAIGCGISLLVLFFKPQERHFSPFSNIMLM